MASTSDSDRDRLWLDFLDSVEHRAGMYTATATLGEISALLVGFDNGVGQGIVHEFQEWMSDRHPEMPYLVFWHLILHESTGDHETNRLIQSLSEDENQEAVATLFTLLKRFIGERQASPGVGGSG
jgi:hypothetical protein